VDRSQRSRLFSDRDVIDPAQVQLTSDCEFSGNGGNRAKCNAVFFFGRALHGVQDFYSHSNWADEAAPGPNRSDLPTFLDINRDNPPGLITRPRQEKMLVPRDLARGRHLRQTSAVPAAPSRAQQGQRADRSRRFVGELAAPVMAGDRSALPAVSSEARDQPRPAA
jgi:hypothetical protein